MSELTGRMLKLLDPKGSGLIIKSVTLNRFHRFNLKVSQSINISIRQNRFRFDSIISFLAMSDAEHNLGAIIEHLIGSLIPTLA